MGVVAHALMPVILALGRLRLEDREFEASLGYIIRKKKKVAVPELLLVLGKQVNVCDRNSKSNALARISGPAELLATSLSRFPRTSGRES